MRQAELSGMRTYIAGKVRHKFLERIPAKANRKQHFLGTALLLAACLSGSMAGCQQKTDAPPPTTPNVTQAGQPPAAPPDPVKPPAPVTHPAFDGEKAMTLLKKQCDFGVRPLGTEAHEKTRAYLLAEMKKYADETIVQEFRYRNLPVANIVGVFYPQGAAKPSAHPVLLLAHWDTRPIADGPYSSETKKGVRFRYGANGWKPAAPIMGADDAASGVAVLLELARLLKEKRPNTGVILLLDDGEDYGDFEANGRQGDGVELGARYFAKHFRETPAYGQPSFGILLDMVGAKDAFFPRDQDYSEKFAASTNTKVFSIAQELGYGARFPSDKWQLVGDDHISLNEAGIPTIDLIHPLPYGDYVQSGYTYWHTLEDTPDKCSAATLKVVGDVVTETIYREPAAP